MSVPRPRELVSVAAVISIALVVLVFCLTHRNSISYGPGPDPFDYITTAHHLVDHGTLRFTNTVAQGLDIDPRYNVYFVPEPFVILPPGQTYASLYPPGTSLLMALSLVTVGDIGPYLLGPVLAAGCVILIALLAYSLFGAAGAVTAASLLAACPIFLAPARAPLSDIPALFFVLLSLVLLSAGRPTTAVIAGLAFGMAVMIRLNLAVILPATMLWGLSQAPRSRRLGHLFAFAAGVAPGIVLLGGINAFLYGSPLTSGYALKTDFHDPFSLAFFPQAFPRWLRALVMGSGPLTIVAAIYAAVRSRDRRVLTALLWVGSVILFFSVYRLSGNIRLQRFILPCFPALILLALAGATLFAGRSGRVRLPLPTGYSLLVAASVLSLFSWANRYQLTRPYDRDDRAPYLDLAAIANRVGPDAVVFSRVYGGILTEEEGIITANWSQAGALGARSLVREILAQGRPIYLLESKGFFARGRWWLGENVKEMPSSTAGVLLGRVEEPLPNVTIPLRSWTPQPRGSED